jgi:hypothetical protein
MPSRFQNLLGQRAATPFSVPQPLVAASQNPPCQHAATLPQLRILSDPHVGVAQVLDKSEPETEPEQSLENTWLTKAQETNLSNSLKTKGQILTKFFIENEPEHFLENKQH